SSDLADTVLTVNIITAESTSTRITQSASKVPAWIQRNSSTLYGSPPRTPPSTTQEHSADRIRPPQVTSCAPRSPVHRPKRPATIAPSSGKNTTQVANMAQRPPVIDCPSSTVASPLNLRLPRG